MAFQKIENVKISGIAACVPDHVVDNSKLELLGNADEIAKFIETTGIAKRYTIGDKKICTSDLCFEAAEKVIADLNWNKNEIDCLIFVTQTPDYILPATSCVSPVGLAFCNHRQKLSRKTLRLFHIHFLFARGLHCEKSAWKSPCHKPLQHKICRC